MDQNKAIGGAVGGAGASGVGGAVATLVVSIWWKNADPGTVAALTTLINAVIGAGGAYLGAYLTPHSTGG